MIKTAATLFSGGEGVGVGLRMAGINHAWGIEYDDAIAQVARNNGFNVVTADVRECDPSNFADVDWLHASPPCINASIANNSAEVNEDGTKETSQDIELAEAVIRFIEAKQPQIFTLENVYFYRKFKSFKKIIKVLHNLGYAFNYWHVCMADYGGLTRCPIHHAINYLTRNAACAETDYLPATAPGTVTAGAMMKSEEQATILAWDAVAELARQIPLDIAECVTLHEWVQQLPAAKQEKRIRAGKEVEELTNEAMSECDITEGTLESIALLLNICLAESSIQARLFTTSMEIQQITAQKILRCLLTIPYTLPSITDKIPSQMGGDLETSGNECPLCKFSGVPQTRNRLILIARRDGVRPSLPPTTHAKNPKQTLFGSLQKWVGWYASIEDLIPTLPDSEFAPWQIARLPEEIKESFLPHIQVNSGTDGRWATEPSTTIAAEKWPNRAVLVEGRNPTGGTDRLADQPSGAVTLSHPPRALLMNKNQTERDDYCKADEEPAYTVTPGDNGRRRAFIVNDGDSKQPVIEEERPFGTVKTLATGGAMSRAFVVDGKLSSSNGEKILQINMEDEPHGTVVASTSPLRDGRAVAQGRVVQMTPRALARFQSFPDWYILPMEANKKTVTRQLKRYFVSGIKPPVVDGWALEYIETDMDLACKVIGNAVPPLFMQRLAETFIPKRP